MFKFENFHNCQSLFVVDRNLVRFEHHAVVDLDKDKLTKNSDTSMVNVSIEIFVVVEVGIELMIEKVQFFVDLNCRNSDDDKSYAIGLLVDFVRDKCFD